MLYEENKSSAYVPVNGQKEKSLVSVSFIIIIIKCVIMDSKC